MKKFFTLAVAACLGSVYANAQDPSNWKAGQEVTSDIKWKAYDAADEDPANPVWQGFKYGASSEWEFRPAGVEQYGLQTEDANKSDYFMCWGVYNLPELDIYQEIEMPAGVYTVSVSGCYRAGQDDPTLELYKKGDKTKNCFVYVQVGDDVYETSMMYKFQSSITERVTPEAAFTNNNWGNEKGYNYNGTTIYSPQSHSCADWFLENGHFSGNDVLFAVPADGTKVRIGIKKPVAVPQDQIWWNHWKMYYESEFNDAAKAMIAAKQYDALKETAENFTSTVQDTYGALGALMYDEIGEIEIENKNSLESVNKAIAEIIAANELNQKVFAKTKAMEKNLDICKGIAQITDYAGKAAFESAIETASALLYSDELGEDTELQSFLDAADALAKGRIDYLLTQEKGADGSYDFTHALSFPWWVNQENTGVHDETGYHYPENVQNALNSCDDGGDGNLESGKGKQGGNATEYEAVANKAHWSIEPEAENTWVYDDKWNGWHGGMQAFIQKLKGYAGINSDWSNGANKQGGMWVYQNLSQLPDGYYTLEGNVWHHANNDSNAPGWEDNNNYMFVLDGEGNEIAKVMQEEQSRGYWDGWDPSMYTVLKTDFFYLKGGKARMGYHNNTWMLNSIMELKYYGTEIDYTGIVQNKIAAIAPGEDDLWGGDKKAYDALIAKVVFPIAGEDAYNEAVAIVNEAAAYKNKAKSVKDSFNVPEKYVNLSSNYEDAGLMDQAAILDKAWDNAMEIGNGEDDTYPMAEEANKVYTAYESYLTKYDDALGNYGSDDMKATLAEQTTYLKANYATVEKLAEFESAIATKKNAKIFADMGAGNATEKDPLELTEKMLNNPTFAEGPKTGWICEGADVNPGINTYGRELAECWNQKPFTISQTLRALPAGTYEIRVRACYRDESAVTQGSVDRLAACEGDYSKLENNNAQLFANDAFTYVKSTSDCGWEDPSFTKWYNAKGVDDDFMKAEGFLVDWDGTIFVSEDEYKTIIDKYKDDDSKEDILFALMYGTGSDEATSTSVQNIDMASPSYPFDTKVGDKYYPCSMVGFKERITKSPDAYCNTVRVYVEEGGDLQLGLRKTAAIGNDWLIFDDFQLFYLGNDPATAVTNVNTVAQPKAIYNLAGQRLNALQKGINIVDGKKIMVK